MRRLSWIFAACCGIGVTPAFGCGDAATLLGTHGYDVSSPRLLRIEQNGTDLLVAVDNERGTTLYNHPNDRGFFELAYLQPADGARQQVCVHSVYRNAEISAPYSITEIDLGTLDTALLQDFATAARLWAEDGPARTQALALYTALGQADATKFPWREHATLFAVRGHTISYDADPALRALAGIAADSSVFEGLPHLLPWYEGAAYLRKYALPEAIDALTRAQALAPQTLDAADIANLLGEALVGANRVDDGERQLEAARVAAGSDHSLLARIHNNRGYVFLRRAFAADVSDDDAQRWLRASIDEHLVARAFAINGNDVAEQILIDNNLGTLYERVRELRKAQHHYREALRLTEATGDAYRLRLLYMNLGALNQRLGDYPKSRGYLEQALRLYEQADVALAYRITCLLGTTYRLLGALDEARTIHEACRDQAAGAPDYPTLIDALVELSEDHVLAARETPAALASAWTTLGAARSLLEQHLPAVLASAEAARLDPLRTNLCTAPRPRANAAGATLDERELALAARVLQRHALLAPQFASAESALRDLDLAAALVGSARYSGQLDIYDAALRVYGAQGNIDFARACGEAALLLSERLHEDLEAERNGPAWSARTHETYVALADLLLAQDAPLAAFDVAERGMAISLRQHLSLPPVDGQQEEAARLLELLNTLADEHAALSAAQKADLLPVAYYHQHDLVELARLRTQQSVAVPPALDAAAVQARLRGGETVLYYYIGAKDAWLFELAHERFVAHRLGAARELAVLLAAVEDQLRTPNGTPTAGLRALAAFLLPGTLALDDTRELLIVPHRDLYKIPFAALIHAGDSALIDVAALKTTPSLSAYFMDKPAAVQSYDSDIAVFADPLFNSADIRGASAGLDADAAALQRWSAGLERLPYTETEAAGLKELFQPERTLAYLGPQATLANLVAEPARNARILHLATHGYFQSTSSDNVGLVLATIDANNKRVPGFVTLPELFAHRFNNELVVISGCDTALGMQLAGEGMMGLTRGFLAQGARHVISTLWPVSDRASAQFMALFYRELHAGLSVAEALRTAQQQLKAMPEFRHPYYWAPYVLTTVSPSELMDFAALSR